ncbi:MAG TPA: MFS transporter [Microbacteriaceae bacterium]|nr:MFS transporter [Microbacteriaceae bacterium]
MNQYVEILRTPGVARIVSSQLLARFPYGMLSISVLLYIHERTDSYAIAGLVLAACSIGQAIAGPFSSRFMGQWGVRRVLIIETAVAGVALTVLALDDFAAPVYVGLGFVIGLSMPPVGSAVRTLYPKLVPAHQTSRLYSLDATAQEIIWVVGPIVATFVGTQLGGAWGIGASVAFLVGGGAWFISSPELGRVRIPPSRRRFGAVLTQPSIAVVTVTGFLLVGLWSAIEAGVVTAFGEGNAAGGFVLAISSIGSIAGGLAFGHLPIRPWTIARRMLIMTFGVALALASLDFWWLSLALFVTGIGTAPALAALSTVVSASLKFSDTAEAYGWVSTGQLIGAALGSGIAGILIDHVGSIGAILTGLGFGVAAVAVSSLAVRSLPDLRGRDISPQADTDAIQSVD